MVEGRRIGGAVSCGHADIGSPYPLFMGITRSSKIKIKYETCNQSRMLCTCAIYPTRKKRNKWRAFSEGHACPVVGELVLQRRCEVSGMSFEGTEPIIMRRSGLGTDVGSVSDRSGAR